VKFGLMTIVHNRAAGDAAAAFGAFVELATVAEELGFWSIWTTEHHFGSDPAYRPFGVPVEDYPSTDMDVIPDPITALTYLAAKTTRLRLGTAVAVLHWDHPVRTAERAAMLDVLSDGRLELGVGRGAGYREIEAFGVPTDPDVNRRRYHEAIAIVRGLWSGEPFSFRGEFYRVPEVMLRPRPRQQPAPIWVGSGSVESAAWAAQQHLPYATVTWPLTEIETYRKKRAAFRSEAAASGYDVANVSCPHVLFLYCAESDAEAAETVVEYAKQYQYIIEQHYEFGREHGENRAVQSAFRVAAESDLTNIERLARFPVDNHIVGGVETCIERVEFFRRELGVDYLVCNVGWGLVPHERTLASIRRFAEHVMPHFRA
jgi:probable F420-dependent oxidoreductase